ncbi:MAG TPA: peptidase M48, partial [Flavobacteriaceae bacterium]|nr:peptidase M48 [Flavobacteriaceae bacterium]
MTATALFYIIIGILVLNFVIDKILDTLNAKHFNDPIPAELQDVYNKEEYEKSQAYKKEKYRFGMLTSSISMGATLLFFFLDGFELVDQIARSFSENNIIVALIFFGIIMLANDVLSTPFSYYNTFVIEEKYGFNKTTISTFILDKLKGWLMAAILGGGILSLIIWFYES